MKIFNKLVVTCFSLVFGFTSCDKDFEKINTDPNNPLKIPSGVMITDIVVSAMNTQYSTFIGGDMGACWAQQWGKVQYNDEARYTPRVTSLANYWDVLYEDVVSDANSMHKLAVKEKNANMQAVGLVLQAYGYSLLTDAYGNIPFSESIKAVSENNLTPVYDSQEEVYKGIVKMLKDANALFSTDEKAGDINKTSDILYKGDVSKWKKFANTLLFRVLMRMSATSDVSGELKALVSSGNLFTSNADDAQVVYLGADPNANPIFETIVHGSRSEWKAGKVLVDMLENTKDPRLAVYVGKNKAGKYKGKPAGYRNLPNDDYGYDNMSPLGKKYLDPKLPGVMISYVQLKFLMAEAALKGLIDGGNTAAEAHFDAGYLASFEANNVKSPGSPPNAFVNLSTDKSAALKQIGEQMWLGLYCQGVEAWTEWRRTGFPVLKPAAEAAIDKIPTRYTYPNDEQSLNATNYAKAVEAQGADLLTTELWWDK